MHLCRFIPQSDFFAIGLQLFSEVYIFSSDIKMPFMKGRSPIRRTIQYLQAGKLVLKDKIKIFSVNYNIHGKHHEGAKAFVFWTIPQLQYKNPDVQVITFRNLTPSPFIRCYFGKMSLRSYIPKHLLTKC